MRADVNPVGFRLRSARGHLDGVIRMVEEDRCCIDVLDRLSAATFGTAPDSSPEHDRQHADVTPSVATVGP